MLNKLNQSFSTFLVARNPYWPKFFCGSLKRMQTNYEVPFQSKFENIFFLSDSYGTQGFRGTPVENHWAKPSAVGYPLKVHGNKLKRQSGKSKLKTSFAPFPVSSFYFLRFLLATLETSTKFASSNLLHFSWKLLFLHFVALIYFNLYFSMWSISSTCSRAVLFGAKVLWHWTSGWKFTNVLKESS